MEQDANARRVLLNWLKAVASESTAELLYIVREWASHVYINIAFVAMLLEFLTWRTSTRFASALILLYRNWIKLKAFCTCSDWMSFEDCHTFEFNYGCSSLIRSHGIFSLAHDRYIAMNIIKKTKIANIFHSILLECWDKNSFKQRTYESVADVKFDVGVVEGHRVWYPLANFFMGRHAHAERYGACYCQQCWYSIAWWPTEKKAYEKLVKSLLIFRYFHFHNTKVNRTYTKKRTAKK